MNGSLKVVPSKETSAQWLDYITKIKVNCNHKIKIQKQKWKKIIPNGDLNYVPNIQHPIFK